MTKRPVRNVAHSVHRRLLNLAREANRPFNELLQYYAMERFLFRLSRTPHAGRFVLKGALMLVVWRAPRTRPTMDIDLLGYAENTVGALEAMVRDICQQEVEPDGLVFAADTVTGQAIQDEADYHGVRIRLHGTLGTARVVIQLDVGFGDRVVPEPEWIEYPAILDLPAPRLRGYSRESTIAEKLEAMAKLGPINSRMKDFHDIWSLARHFDFDGPVLREAIAATFRQRGTPPPADLPALMDALAADPAKPVQWTAFLRKSRLTDGPALFSEATSAVAAFAGPVVRAVATGRPFDSVWKAPGPWT